MGLLDRLRELTRPYDDDIDDFEEDMPTARPSTRKSSYQEPASRRYESTQQPSHKNPFAGFSSDYSSSNSSFSRTTAASTREREKERDNKVVNIHATAQLQVVLVKPERFENAAEIADHLREKRTVVMNLEQTNKDTSRRLIDFLSGVAYAQDGKIKKVAVSTFIITPYNVDIMGDLMDELENNGLYF